MRTKDAVARIMIAFLVVFLASTALGAGASSSNALVYHGRILRPTGEPLEESGLRFVVSIYGRNFLQNKRCLLYQEEQNNVDMANSMGAFEIKIGEGNRLKPATLPGGLSRIFLNSQGYTQNNVTCDDSSTTYTADSLDRDREIEVDVHTSTNVINIPSQKLRSVPWSMQAMEIGGYSSDYLLKLDQPMTQQFPTAAAQFLRTSVQISGGVATGRLLNIANPVNATDVANKAYVDSLVAGSVAAGNGIAVSGATVSTRIDGTTIEFDGSGVMQIRDGSISSAKLENGSVTFSKIAGGGCAAGTLMTYDGASWGCSPLTVPNIDASKITTGILPVARGGTNSSSFFGNKVIVSNGTGNTLTGFSCNVGETIKFDVSGVVGCYTDSGITSESDPSVQAWAKAAPGTSFDTTGNVLNLTNTGVTAGTYTKVTVDGKGRVTTGGSLLASDIPNISANYIAVGATAGGQLSGTYPSPSIAQLGATSGQVLKWNGTAWAPAADIDTTNAGDITDVTVTAPLAVANSSGPNPAISIAAGTTAGQTLRWNGTDWIAAQLAATDITGTSSLALAGDVTGTLGANTVTKIRGVNVVATAPTANQVLKYDGTNWVPSADNDTNTTYTAGDALTLTAGDFDVAVDNSTIEVNADALRIKDGGITAAKLNQMSATSGQVLKWNGTAWAPAADIDTTNAGDITDVTVAAPLAVANSSGPNPAISIAAGTTAGQTLRWNGTNWVSAQLAATDITGTSSLALAGDVTGTLGANTVTKIRGVNVVATAPTANQVLKYDGTNWVPSADATGAAPGDATTSSKGIMQVGTGLNVASGVVSVAYGTTAGTAVQGNDSRLSDSRAPTGSAGGDLAGTYPNPTLAQNGATIGQVLKWNGTAWAPAADADTNTTYTAGDALTLTAGDFDVNVDNSTIEVNTDALRVKDSGITSAKIADGTIVDADISATANINATKLGTGVVDNTEFSYLNGVTSSIQTQLGAKVANAGNTPSIQAGTLATRPAFGTAGRIYVTTDTNAVYRDTGTGWALVGDGNNTYTFNSPLSESAGAVSLGTVPIASGGTGTTSFAANQVVVSNGTGAALAGLTCTSGQVIKFDASGFAGCGADSGLTSESDPQVGANTTNYLSKWNGSALVASGVFDNGTNVGIGTTTPGVPLDIVGGTGPTVLRITSPSTNATNLVFTNTDTGGRTWSVGTAGTSNVVAPGSFAIYDNTAPAMRFTILPSGNVGIGTATPSQKLDVAGNVNATQLCIAGSCKSAWDAASVGAMTANYLAKWDGSLFVNGSVVDDGTKVYSANYFHGASTGASGKAFQIGNDSSIQDIGVANTAGLYGETTPAEGGLKLGSGGGTLYGKGGNIGIANTNPGYPLDVTGTVRASGEIISTNANQLRMVQGNYGAFYRNDGASLYTLLTAFGDPYGTWNALRPFTINLATGNVDIGSGALVITHGGNISAPAAPTAGAHVANKNYVDAQDATKVAGSGTANYIPKFTAGGTIGNSTITDNGSNVSFANKTSMGSTATDYNAAGGDWNFTMTLNGLNTTSLGFHDSAATVGSIKFNASGFTIGGESGWGTHRVFTPGGITTNDINDTGGNFHIDASGGNATYINWYGGSGGVNIGNGGGGHGSLVANAVTGNTSVTGGEVYSNGWLRSNTSGTGWHHQVHGGGWFMSDNTWIRNYGNKSLWMAGAGTIMAVEGSLGVGTSAPGYKADIAGAVRASAYYFSSDQRLKKNIESIHGLEMILKMRGVRFDWIKNGEGDIGLIAQEVEKVAPDLVSTDPQGFKSVKYGNIVAPLIEATKTLYGDYQVLQEDVDKYADKLSSVDRRVASLEQKLAEKDQQLQKQQSEIDLMKKQIEFMMKKLDKK